MSDSWMPMIRLALTIDEFHQLPRNAAYRYEYLRGQAHLSPRPRHYHALLDLQPMTVPEGVEVHPVRAADLVGLIPLFAAVFRTIQPFGSLDDAMRREAARQALERTYHGGDGPWIEPASFVAREEERIVGAILVTLLPDADPCEWDSYRWTEPPPVDCVERALGRPHLTWIFVSPWLAGQGIGTALLASAVNQLRAMGYQQLLSTFMIGNESSMLWHWRNGFRLLPYPGSMRRLQSQSHVLD